MNRVTLLTLGLILLATAASAEIRLGMSAVFSGPTQALGQNFYDGANAHISQFNSGGGVNGERVNIISYDDTYNPLPTIRNTITLVEQDDVLMLFNYVGTPTTVAMLPLLKLYDDDPRYAGLVLFGNFTGAGAQRSAPYDRFVFNIRASYSQETNALVRHFLAQGHRRIGVFYQIDGYGRSGYVGVEQSLRERGMRVAAEATYVRGSGFTTDMSVQAQHFVAANVDAIVSVGAYNPCAAFVRDARNAGFEGPIANISFVGTESMIQVLEDNKVPAENLYFSEVVPDYKNSPLPIVADYKAAVAAAGTQPSFGSFEGFLNARILTEILTQAEPGELRRANMRALIENMQPIDLGLGEPLAFTPTRHQLLNQVFIYELTTRGLEPR